LLLCGQAASHLQVEEQKWGEKHAGSYCCFNVDPLTKGRFNAVSKGYVNTDEIDDCDVTADKACPVEGDQWEKKEDGSNAVFLNQAALWDKATGNAGKLEAEKMEKVKAVLHTHVKENVHAYDAYEKGKVEDAFTKAVDARMRAIHQKYKTQIEELEQKYQYAAHDHKHQNDAKVEKGTKVAYDAWIKKNSAAIKQNEACNQEAQATLDTAIQEARGEHDAAVNDIKANSGDKLKQFIEEQEALLEADTKAADDELAQQLHDVEEELKTARDAKLAPIANLVEDTNEAWSVSEDIAKLYPEKKAVCEGDDCCCLSTLGEDSRTYHAYKVPKNFAFSTCVTTAPYTDGFFGVGTCKYFKHCKGCIKKLCDDEAHCGAASLA
jgi:hypothetical protein